MPIKNLNSIIQTISAKVFEYENKSIDDKLVELISKNNEQHATHSYGIIMMGMTLYPMVYSKNSAVQKIGIPKLSFKLIKEGQAFIIEYKSLELDKTQINQMFHKLLYPCHNIQDVRDALPECIVSLFPDLLSNPRVRKEAYTLTSNLLIRQYEQIHDKLIAYSMAKMIY